MASLQDQLISRIIREGLPAYRQALEWGLTPQDLTATMPASIFRTFDDYYRSSETKGSIPGQNLISVQYPTFVLSDDQSMSLEALCREVRNERIKREVKEICSKAITEADFDPLTALSALQSNLTPIVELGTSRKTDVFFQHEVHNILSEYEAAERGEMRGVASWPWPTLQTQTGGLQEDDFIVFYGRPKSMKTWVVCFLLAYLYENGHSIVLYTKEMTPHNIFKRIAACLARVPYQELRLGQLTPQHKRDLFDVVNLLASPTQKQLIALSAKDVAQGGDTVAWLRTKVEKYDPDVIAIDGMYLMSDGSNGKSADWTRVTRISREVSQMRLDLRKPVIATMQANRKAAGHSNAEMDEVAYADAVGQDATIACRVINEKSKPTIALVLAGSREFQLHGLRIGGVPATDFEEKEQMTEKEILKSKEEDAKKDDEPENPAVHSKPRRTPRTSANAQTQGLLEQQLKGIL